MTLIAIPAENKRGRHSVIAKTLSRARMITLVRVNGKPVVEETLDNSFFQHTHGAGPLLANHLMNLGVEQVIAKQVGPGSRSQLESLGIKVKIDPDSIRVEQALKSLG